MELRQLRYFLAVVETGSFSAAADKLGRTQQAISKGIQQLEERLGVRLLDRDARTLRPTAFGELLLGRAADIDAALRRFDDDLAAWRSNDAGPVRIGASPTAAARVVSGAVLALAQSRPGLRCVVRDGIDRDLLPALQRGELDLVVALQTVDEPDRDLRLEVLGHERYGIVCGPQHPLARRESVTPAELAAYPWVHGRQLGDVEEAMRGAFESHGMPAPPAAIETTSLEFARALLVGASYLTVLPLSVAAASGAPLKQLVIDGFEWRRPLTLFRHRAALLSPAALAVVDALHRVATSPQLTVVEGAASA